MAAGDPGRAAACASDAVAEGKFDEKKDLKGRTGRERSSKGLQRRLRRERCQAALKSAVADALEELPVEGMPESVLRELRARLIALGKEILQHRELDKMVGHRHNHGAALAEAKAAKALPDCCHAACMAIKQDGDAARHAEWEAEAASCDATAREVRTATMCFPRVPLQASALPVWRYAYIFLPIHKYVVVELERQTRAGAEHPQAGAAEANAETGLDDHSVASTSEASTSVAATSTGTAGSAEVSGAATTAEQAEAEVVAAPVPTLAAAASSVLSGLDWEALPFLADECRKARFLWSDSRGLLAAVAREDSSNGLNARDSEDDPHDTDTGWTDSEVEDVTELENTAKGSSAAFGSAEALLRCLRGLLPAYGWKTDPRGKRLQVGVHVDVLQESTGIPRATLKQFLTLLSNQGEVYETLADVWMPFE